MANLLNKIVLETFKYHDGNLQIIDEHIFNDEPDLVNYIRDHAQVLLVKLVTSQLFIIKNSLRSRVLQSKLLRILNIESWMQSIPDLKAALSLYQLYPALFIDKPAINCLSNQSRFNLMSGNHLIKTLSPTILDMICEQHFTTRVQIPSRTWLNPFKKGSWQAIFNALRRSTVEQIAYSLDLDCSWQKGQLSLSKRFFPLISNDTTGESIILNLLNSDAESRIVEAIQQSFVQHSVSLMLSNHDILLFHQHCYLQTYD